MAALDQDLPAIRQDLERVQHEIFAIGHIDDVFWQMAAIARDNPAVMDPSVFMDWAFQAYVDSVVVRLRRLADRRKGTLSLWRVLERLKPFSFELTRVRFHDLCSQPVRRLADGWFDELAGGGTSAVSKARILKKQDELNAALAKVERYANDYVAHAALAPSCDPTPTLDEVRTAIIAAVDVFNWCSLLLNCGTTFSVVPAILSNWLRVFRQPWLPEGRKVPEYENLDDFARRVRN